MAKSACLTFSLFLDDEEYRVIGYYYPGDPGQTSGPVERCYPPEPDEFISESVEWIGHSGAEIPEDILYQLETMAEEKAAEIYANQKDFP